MTVGLAALLPSAKAACTSCGEPDAASAGNEARLLGSARRCKGHCCNTSRKPGSRASTIEAWDKNKECLTFHSHRAGC